MSIYAYEHTCFVCKRMYIPTYVFMCMYVSTQTPAVGAWRPVVTRFPVSLQSVHGVSCQDTRRDRSSPSSRPSSCRADEVARAMEELEKSLAEMRESLQWRDEDVRTRRERGAKAVAGRGIEKGGGGGGSDRLAGEETADTQGRKKIDVTQSGCVFFQE